VGIVQQRLDAAFRHYLRERNFIRAMNRIGITDPINISALADEHEAEWRRLAVGIEDWKKSILRQLYPLPWDDLDALARYVKGRDGVWRERDILDDGRDECNPAEYFVDLGKRKGFGWRTRL